MTETPRPTLPLHDEGNGQAPLQFLTLKEVCKLTTLHRDSLWKLRAEGKFPRGHCIGEERSVRVVWFRHDVEKWMLERPVRRLMGESDGVAPPRHLRSDIHPRRRLKRSRLSTERAAELEAMSGVRFDES